MKITDTGTLSASGTGRNVHTFPAVAALSDGRLFATCRAGSRKDCDEGLIESYVSHDDGRSWSEPRILFDNVAVDGKRGSLHLCYVTEREPGRLLAGLMWIDRQAYPGKPLFNAQTEGCLPMAILLSDSSDGGQTWSAPRQVGMPEEIGPPSLTNPIIKLADGSLAMSIETNKAYEDPTKWYQKVVFFFSRDGGMSWGDMTTVGFDPEGRYFNWDQRLGVGRDGTVAAYVWTYDTATRTYLNIRRRLSDDKGRTWSEAEKLDFADQAGPPAALADGRIVLPWVDRFGSHSIRARMGATIQTRFERSTEIEVYSHMLSTRKPSKDTTGDVLEDQGFWTYGLPFAVALPSGGVLVVYYAGDNGKMDIRFARIDVG